MYWLKGWQWFGKADTLQLFLYLLVNANTEDRYWQGTLIKRGQIVVTIPSLAEVLNSTIQKVRTNLKQLSTSLEINRQVTNKYTIVTICNYDSYIGVKTDNQQATNRQPTDNQQATKKENISPTPPIKEKIITPSLSGGQKESSRFQPPTISEVQNYILENGYTISASRFIDFYQSKNWYVGKNKMKDWKAAVRNWAARDKEQNEQRTHTPSKADYLQQERERITREIAQLNENYLGRKPG